MASTSASYSSIMEPKKYNDSVYEFYVPPNAPKAEFMFFHDVLWKEYEEPHLQSWTSSETPNCFWPEVLLKPKYPEARILSVRYDAAIRKTENGGYMELFQVAENLQHDILDIYAGNCPLVLVGHGFGGLIIKALIMRMVLEKSLTNCEQSANKLYCFVENVKGIFYFDPPFMGTKLADSMKDLPHAGSLVKFLEVLNKKIGRLNDMFSRWRRNRCKTTVILAGRPTKVEIGQSKMVNKILSQLQQHEAIYVKIDDFSRFPDTWNRLIAGLQKAGFEKTNTSAGRELWAK